MSRPEHELPKAGVLDVDTIRVEPRNPAVDDRVAAEADGRAHHHGLTPGWQLAVVRHVTMVPRLWRRNVFANGPSSSVSGSCSAMG